MGKEEPNKFLGKMLLGTYISIMGLDAIFTVTAVELAKNYLEQEAKEVPIEETVKNKLLQEYKSIFLKDKNLKLVFTEQELNKTMEEQIKSIKIAEQRENWSGTYSSQQKKITITPEYYKIYREDVLFHEITHGVFTRGDYETGFHLSGYIGFIGKEFFDKGRGLNEGATEYIAQKLIEDTSYNNYLSYGKNVEIIKHLCITYGEEFIFKALKEGPQVLAERLEKDGVSYNELSEVMDEMTTTKDQKKQQQLAERAEKIARGLLVKKYKQATPEERLEIANRAREIQAEQGMGQARETQYDTKIIDDPIKLMENIKYDAVDCINADVYNKYMGNNKIIPNVNGIDARVIKSIIHEFMLGTNSIPIEDIKNIEITKLKQPIDEAYVYALGLNGKIIGSAYSHKNGAGFVNETDTKKMKYPNSQKVLNNLEKKYELVEEGKMMGKGLGPMSAFVLNTNAGMKFFVYDNERAELLECPFEGKFKLGDAIEDKNPVKQNIFRIAANKVKDMLNWHKTKLLPAGEQSNTATPRNLYAEDGDFSKGKNIQPPIDDSKIISEDNTGAPQGFYSTKHSFAERYKVDQKELHSKQLQNKQHHKQDGYER